MKLTIVALIGAASAVELKLCTTTADCTTTEDDTQCCGVAAKGLVCKDSTCAELTAVTAPNIVVCNLKDTPADLTTHQQDATGANPVYAEYKGANFTCGAKQLVASGLALLAAASMM